MSDLSWMKNWHGVTGNATSNTFLRGDGTFSTVGTSTAAGGVVDAVSSGANIDVTGAAETPSIALSSYVNVVRLNVSSGSTLAELQAGATTLASVVVSGGSTFGTVQAGASTFAGLITASSGIVLPNNIRYQAKLSDGTAKPILYVDATNTLIIRNVSTAGVVAIQNQEGTVNLFKISNSGNSTLDGTWQVTGGSTFSSQVAIKGPRPWIDVTAYGATGDGVTDDRDAINSALAAAGKRAQIYLPAGRYVMNGRVSVSNKHLTICGAGPQATVLQQDASTGGGMSLSITTNLSCGSYNIRDLAIVASTICAQPAIAISGVHSDAWADSVVQIDNVRIQASSVGRVNAYFPTGIALNNCWYPKLSRVIISADTSTIVAGTIGVEWSSYCQGATITDSEIYNVDRGVVSTNFNEGHVYTNNEIVSVTDGIDENSDTERPIVHIANNHVASRRWGIRINNHPQAGVCNNVIYRQNASASSFTGIYLTGASDFSRIHGNYIGILGTTAVAGSAGIVSSNAYGSIIGNTILYGPGTGSTFTGIVINGRHNTVIGNIGATMSTIVVDGGSSNVVANNTVG